MTEKPNVIVIVTDDQGYGDLACHGNPVVQTPNLDRLHEESIRFTDFHVAPMCTPTRGQLLTGTDAARNGALNVSSGRTLLSTDYPTMADYFSAAGYATGIFGKWHLGDNYPFRPEDRGFQEVLWFPSSHVNSVPDYWENDYFDDVYQHNGIRERQRGYCTEVFFDRAMEWMERQSQSGQPFLTYLPTNAPHAPLWVPPDDRIEAERYFAEHEHEMASVDPAVRPHLIRFLAMISNFDRHLGRLRQFLEARHLAANTLILFLTDNGSTFGNAYYNANMKGAKTELWEGGHRVPCFLHWAGGGVGAPRDVPGLTQAQDILPTLLDLCDIRPETLHPSPGASTGPRPEFDGVSLAPVVRGEASPPESRMIVINYSRMPHNFDYPSPEAPSVVRRDGSAVLWRRWRLLNEDQLYDLDSDPLQERNVITDHPSVAKSMSDHLQDWWEDVMVPANSPQAVIVGSPHENPTLLSACEWRDVFVDMQNQVRLAVRRNSYTYIDVAWPGTYTVALRRWPEESGLALGESCPETQVTDGTLPAGESLPIRYARIHVQGQHLQQEVNPESQEAVFTIELATGRSVLHTWFDDEAKRPICGAYYVTMTAQR